MLAARAKAASRSGARGWIGRGSHAPRRAAVPRRVSVPVLLLAGLAGCRAGPAPALDAELARYNAFVARQAGDSIAAMYAPDGELDVPGRPPLRGPAAIAAFLDGFTDVRVDSSAMWADSLVPTDSGVAQWGHYYQRATVPGRAAPVTARGGFVALWRRDARGRWRLRSMRTY